MTPDDEIRSIIARVESGDKLEITFKPGIGEEHHLRARGVEAVRYLAIRHNSQELQFSPEDGQRLWTAVRNRAFGAGNSRSFTMTVPDYFERAYFADAMYEQLEEVKVLPRASQGEPILLNWVRHLFGRRK